MISIASRRTLELSQSRSVCYPMGMVERKRIIDLRNQDGVFRAPAPQSDTRVPAIRRTQAPATLLAWSAQEYEHRERQAHWWLWPGGGALALTLLGILIHSYFFVAFVALAFAVIVMYDRRLPREIAFRVTREGVMVGRALHRFTDIKSFCIFDTVAPYELSLEVDRITAPYLRLPLGAMHPNKIRAVLSDYLPEVQHKEFMSDHFARALGF